MVRLQAQRLEQRPRWGGRTRCGGLSEGCCQHGDVTLPLTPHSQPQGLGWLPQLPPSPVHSSRGRGGQAQEVHTHVYVYSCPAGPTVITGRRIRYEGCWETWPLAGGPCSVRDYGRSWPLLSLSFVLRSCLTLLLSCCPVGPQGRLETNPREKGPRAPGGRACRASAGPHQMQTSWPSNLM